MGLTFAVPSGRKGFSPSVVAVAVAATAAATDAHLTCNNEPPYSCSRVRAFKRWMKFHGIDCSDALDIVDSPSTGGISVMALCNMAEGDLVATIPKLACLTIRTSGASEMIEAAGLEGYLGLAVAVMYERSLGSASPWIGYLQLLPERESVPLVWSLEEVDGLLSGTEIHKTVKEDKSFLCEDWKEFIEPLILSGSLKLDPVGFGVEKYFSAKTLVSSRSFQIDDYHGFGMVPLADLFNHKTGAEHVHFTSASSPSSSENETDGEITDASADDKSSLTNSSTHSSGDDPTDLEMIVVRDVGAGAEVFNTYGSMGNAALLHRYGFTEPDNPFDIVNIDLHLVLRWCTSTFSNRHYRARLSLWRRLNFSGFASHNTEYFEVSSDGEPQLELLLLLYIIFLDEDAYEKLKYMEDSFEAVDDTSSVVKLFKITSSECREPLENINELLQTGNVCSALISLADMREELYGSSSLQEDVSKLRRCCQLMERKLYHSLVLRVSERTILSRLRSYASKSKTKKRKL